MHRLLAALLMLVSAAAAHAQAAGAVPDTMAQRLVACTTCHGKEGRATSEGYFPRIAGKPAGYLYHQLVNFRDGRRRNAAMTYLVDHLTDNYLQEIADYFAALELPYPPPQPTTLPPERLAQAERLVRQGDAQRALPSCAACHGERLTGVSPAVPGLVGLPHDYLIAQLGAWRAGTRRAHAPDCMHLVAQTLAPEEIVSVSHWLSAQPVPADATPASAMPGPMPMPCGGVP